VLKRSRMLFVCMEQMQNAPSSDVVMDADTFANPA